MRKYKVRLLLIASGLLLAGCTRYEEVAAPAPRREAKPPVHTIHIEEETARETVEETKESRELERSAKDGMIESFLTGEPMELTKAERRPVAVMISNDKQALPHYGVNHAGVIYEAPVEGTMNRYMAIFEDYDELERIGSVRSCRTYYTYFAREFEALYAHYGQSVFALPYLENMEHIDGIKGRGAAAYYRSTDRKSPHNAYTSAAGLKKAIADLGYPLEYPAGYQGHYHFSRPDMPVLLEGGFAAAYVSPGYPYNAPWFEFHSDDGLYYRFQYGGPEEGDEGQLAVKNILFQYCRWEYYRPSEYLNIDVHTPGSGYYFTNGRGILVDWKKDGEFGVTRYYDKNGQEIFLNPGKTWICIITNDRMDKAEFYGEKTG